MKARSKPVDRRAFEKLFNEYARPLTLFAMQFVRDQGMAEDVIQDVFLYIYEKRDAHPVGDHKEHFLYSLVRNRCLNRLEYQKIRRENNPDSFPLFNQPPEDPFELVSVIEFENQYLQAVERLPSKCRQVFEMSRFEGRNNQEIANQLGLSKRTIETYISKALKILRRKLGKFLAVGLLFLFSEVIFSSCEYIFNCYR
ncbi:MAG: RNA polymerase sigma-70 factor [Bacteroidota bacterium]